MSGRVYVCHTFYHAYVACVKELLLRGESAEGDGACAPDAAGAAAGGPGADLILSTMSNAWGEFPDRIRERGLFRQVLFFDEQAGADCEELQALHRDRGSLFLNLLQRVKYTRLLARLQEPHVPVDFRDYADVYVFCDSDPIGYYLNAQKIRYHALEDGLNSGKLDNQAMLSNAGAFGVKALLAKLGLIFIECGYSRYCIDYEVNDLAANYRPSPNTFAVPRRALYERLSVEDHALLAEVFLPDAEGLRGLMAKMTRPAAMILTEPLCAEDVRARLFGDIVARYRADYDVIIKPHPRDLLDYEALFGKAAGDPQKAEGDGGARGGEIPGDSMEETVSVLTGRFPMEALDDLAEFRVAKLVSVITQVDDVRFAEEIVYLGLDFLDRYEDPAIHRKMERLTGKRIGETAFGGKKANAAAAQAAGYEVRPARPDDRDWWLTVRNDAGARRASTDTGVIDAGTHARWFAAKLADAGEKLYVFLQDGQRAGQLRLSLRRGSRGAETEEAVISYAVAHDMRGRGLGRVILEEAKRLAAEDFPGRTLCGEVKEENTVSMHLFRRCGYAEAGRAEGMVRFVWKT